jgi:hypothetical protein
VKPETPAALSVEPPTQVSADLPPPISVDPPIPVFIKPISLDPPAPVSVEPPTTAPASKPKAKRREKKPKAGPSNESASAGKKRKGDFNNAGRKKRALSKATIDNSDEETGPPVIETASMPTSQVYVDIVTKSSSQSRPQADEPKPPAKQPLAQSQPDTIKPKPRSQSRLVATTFINSLGLSLGDEFYNSGIFLKGLSLDLPRVFHCHFSNVCQGISL